MRQSYRPVWPRHGLGSRADLAEGTRLAATPSSVIDLMRSVLAAEFAGGAHLILAAGEFYRFASGHWSILTPQELGGLVLHHLNGVESDGNVNWRTTIREVVDLLKMSQATGDDIFERGETLPLLNLRNGQLKIEPDGSLDLQRHDPGSGQRHCLNVSYDPEAVSPLYDRALKDIFSNAANPDALIAYFNEIAGYILQPSRPDARIFVFWGDGSDGKSAMIAILIAHAGYRPSRRDASRAAGAEPVHARPLAGQAAVSRRRCSRRHGAPGWSAQDDQRGQNHHR